MNQIQSETLWSITVLHRFRNLQRRQTLLISKYVPYDIRNKSYQARKKYRILKTTLPIPDKYLICDEGYIVPWSFIHRKFVEDVFRTPKRMEFFLLNSSKARLEGPEETLPTFKDQTIIVLAKDIARSLFRKEEFTNLEGEKRERLVHEVRRRTKADVKQLARVLGIPAKEIAAMQ